MIRQVHLIVKEGPAAPQEAVYLPPCEITIGRGRSVQFPLDTDSLTSRQHTCLSITNSAARICDLGSLHGTQVNGQRISRQTPHALHDLDRVYVGETVVLIRLLESPHTPACNGDFAPGFLSDSPPIDTDESTTGDHRQSYNFARFQILGEALGEGNWGIVYRVRDTTKSRGEKDEELALKVISGAEGDARHQLARFVNERWVHQHLKHPNIVRSIAGWEENSQVYHAMELVDGYHLNRYRKIHGEWRGTPEDRLYVLPPRRAFRFARQLLLALHYAHTFPHRFGQGCLHRDIKPHNILIEGKGNDLQAKLTDFGLGRLEGSHPEGMTQVGEALGTKAYLPPEQLEDFSKLTDRRSDLFGLGATLFQALTGRMLYEFDARCNWRDVIRDGRVLKAEECAPWLSPAVCEFLDRATHLVPAYRFQTAREMYNAAEVVASTL